MKEFNEKNWNKLSKYRGELLGLSIISIIIFHYFEDLKLVNINGSIKILSKLYLFLIGSIGVEIFTFFSGLGLYYSLRKKFDIQRYIYNRVKRTVIPYILYGGIFWIILDIIIRRESVGKFSLDYSLLSFWIAGNKNLWFVAFILVMYVIFPFIYIVFTQKGNRALIGICLIYVLGLVIILRLFPTFFSNIEIALTRVPIFLCGIYCGKKSYENEEISMTAKIFFLIGVILKCLSLFDGTSNTPIYWRLRMGIYSLFVMFILVAVLEKLSCEKLNKFLRKVGKISFELYLTSVTIRTIMNEMGYVTYRLSNYLICILATIIMSYVLIKVEKLIR